MGESTDNTVSYRHELQEFVTLRRSYLIRELGAVAVQTSEENNQLISEVISVLTGIDGLYDANTIDRGSNGDRYEQAADNFMLAYQELYGNLDHYALQHVDEHLISLIKYGEAYQSTTLTLIVDQRGDLHPIKDISSLEQPAHANRHTSNTIRDTTLAINAFERLRATTESFRQAHGLR